jgi:integrase
MGRKGSGVEIHGSAIRLSFTLDGKRKRELLMLNDKPMLPTATNMKYAHRIAQEIRERIRHSTFSMAEYFPASGAGDILTVKGWLDKWLNAQKIADSTRIHYTNVVNFWNKTIADKEKKIPVGALALRALKPSHLLTAIAQRPDLTGKTVNNYVSVMRQALDLAVADKIIHENPAHTIPRAKHQEPPPDPFSRDEAEAIIADMASHYPEQIYNMVEAWFFTGLRTSEVYGQRWPNVDLFNKQLTVIEAIVLGKGKKQH